MLWNAVNTGVLAIMDQEEQISGIVMSGKIKG